MQRVWIFNWVIVISLVSFSVRAHVPSSLLPKNGGFDDPRVLLQGFYWESYRHGDPKFPHYGDKRWYQIVKEQANRIREAGFDLIWLPPPSYAGRRSAGYNPKEYWNLSNSYGNEVLHREMLEALLLKGVEPIADIVINHRDGRHSWADFKNPDWGLDAITRYDEVFTASNSPLYQKIPVEERGADEEKPHPYANHGGTTYSYRSFRDLDHTNPRVRQDILKYLLQLKSFGYRGWRYDMVHGYHAKWIALYNKISSPTFTVGEYDWDKYGEQRGWVYWSAHNRSASGADRLRTSSYVFDFKSYWTLKNNKGSYDVLYGGKGGGIGRLGDTTDGLPWKQRAVTFLENHDTGYRTEEAGRPQKGHEHDSFRNGWEVEQGYAYLLTHPGLPTVYWKHYFDWGEKTRSRIRALINARKVAGVHAGSILSGQKNAREQGVYAARVHGNSGDLYVRIGGSDREWQPSDSGYAHYREYASGEGWKVWVRINGNPEVKQAPLNGAFEVPIYRRPQEIEVP